MEQIRNMSFDNVFDNVGLSFGQKLYKLIVEDRYHFKSKCPVCDGAKKVVIRGYECECPYCQTTKNRNEEEILIEKYAVVEYVVNNLKLIGPETKSAYQSKEPYQLRAVWSAFRKNSSSFRNIDMAIVNSSEVIRSLDEFPKHFFDIKSFLFTQKKDAISKCAELNRLEKEKLIKFNEKFGVDNKYPWKEANK